MSLKPVSVLTLCTAAALALSIACTGSAPNEQQATSVSLSPKALEEIDEFFQQQVDESHISGAVALISRYGTTGYFKAFGMRDIENSDPMPEDAVFRIHSMTKPIVVAAALSLYEEGKFDLDDPISEHLPEWADLVVRRRRSTVAANQPVTVRHLMTHSSGVSNADMEGVMTLSQLSERLAESPLMFHPGTNYRYGLSADVLARYIEVVSGQPLDVILRERVLDPLEMSDTGFWIDNPATRDRIAQMYTQPSPGTLQPGISSDGLFTKPSLLSGGGGLVSTATDYGRFCQMLLNGGELDGKRVLKQETVDLVFMNHLSEIDKWYGLGGLVDGEYTYSWGGAAGTQFWIDRKRDYYAVFMVQAQDYKAPTYVAFRGLAEKALR